MAVGLTFGGSPLTGDRISLQDDSGDPSVVLQATPTGRPVEPARAAAVPAEVVVPGETSASRSTTRSRSDKTSKPVATRTKQTTHRIVAPAPAPAPRRIVQPPRVASAGS